MKVLIVEDDRTQNEVLANFLRKDKIEAVSAFSIKDAFEKFDSSVHLVVLDLNLPDGHGFDFLKEIRQRSQVPVIVLSALDDELTQLNVFELQADEYVDKPASPLVMTKRIQALLNRVYPASQRVWVQGYEFDLDQYLVFDPQGEEVALTAKEFSFLKFLLERNGSPVSREQIIEAVWGFEYRDEVRLLDSHVKNIRKKLDPGLIKTVKNVGYRLNMLEADR